MATRIAGEELTPTRHALRHLARRRHAGMEIDRNESGSGILGCGRLIKRLVSTSTEPGSIEEDGSGAEEQKGVRRVQGYSPCLRIGHWRSCDN
ncbi:hypothetical protein GUJ93_ZPchr0007g5663 [Zizania palustris]|uniref:Uncharacterized protein n=1 Tax=Zizania palustris TaxID=103762 RepID=A0A8J5TJN8_ZIZPA|nr:hypothetical protein GUJ93_ZPchr0007g5663 [Zizania palustris]